MQTMEMADDYIHELTSQSEETRQVNNFEKVETVNILQHEKASDPA